MGSIERPHGTRAKYVHEGCRCADCRRACSKYEKRRVRRNAYGLNPWVDAEPVRQHVRSLMVGTPGDTEGAGYKQIAKAAGVERNVLGRLLYGRKTSRVRQNGDREYREPTKRLHKDTADKILAVKSIPLAAGALIPADRTWHYIEEILHYGWTKVQIAQAIGNKGPKLQVKRNRVTVKTARKISKLHWILWKTDERFRFHCDCPITDEVATWLDQFKRRRLAGLR